MPTNDLDIDRISFLCRPLFEEIHSRHPSFRWAGVFGSVSRGTQKPDSDVDIVIGYSPEADFFDDVCYNMATLLKRLQETLGVEVDVIAFIEESKNFRYIDMEAILSAKTIWGDVSWLEANQGVAVQLLQQGYARMKKAIEVMSRVRRKLQSSEVLIEEPMSSEHENLLQDALSVIRLIKVPGDPFYAHLESTMWKMLAKEELIQDYLQGRVDHQALGGIWGILSDVMNIASLRGMKNSAEVTFRRAGLVPLE